MTDLPASNGDHHRLFADLGRALGIDGVAFNEAGVCIMSFDDIVLRFEYQAPLDEIMVTSTIGDVSATAPADLLRELLVLNAASTATGGGSVGIDPNTNNLIWFDHIAPRGLSQQAFQTWLKAAIARHEFWQKMLARLRIGNYQKAEARELAASDMMIRV